MVIVPRGIILKSFLYTTYIYVFLMMPTISSGYFPKQHYLIGMYDEDMHLLDEIKEKTGYWN
jgi:hypothetical protein